MDEDKIIQKLMEHDDRLERIEQKFETVMSKEEGRGIKETLEQVVSIVKKIQDDHFFTIELYKRMQNEIDNQKSELRKQDEEIRKIKMQLKMA